MQAIGDVMMQAAQVVSGTGWPDVNKAKARTAKLWPDNTAHLAQEESEEVRSMALRAVSWRQQWHTCRRSSAGAFLNAAVEPGFFSDEVLIREQVTLCHPIRTGFVHIFKSSGSSVATAFRQQCQGLYGMTSVDQLCPYDFCTIHRPDAAFRNYSFFTFVRRDPIERFVSGVLEIDRRGQLQPWLPSHRQGASGNELALMILRRCLSAGASCSLPQAHHLDPQVDACCAPNPTLRLPVLTRPAFEPRGVCGVCGVCVCGVWHAAHFRR